MDKNNSIRLAFEPLHIAVVGASRDPSSVGYTLTKNILDSGYKGTVSLVNPHAESILNIRCYQSLQSISSTIDCAVVAVPAPIVPSILRDMGSSHIPVAIIISSGFNETGERGMQLQYECRRIADENGITVIGPNCLGIINTSKHINMTFAKSQPFSGSIAIISQSGAFCSSFLDFAQDRHLGISVCISLGNKMHVNEQDILSYLIHDPATNVICVYTEQISDARRWIQTVQACISAQPPKPVLVLKGGKTSTSSKAVFSHTGSMTGSVEIYKALIKQSGAVWMHDLAELIDHAIAFSTNPLPSGNACVILTNAGGPGILGADALVNSGGTLAVLDTGSNPYDLLGDATPKQYDQALNMLYQNPKVDGICVFVTPQATTDIPAIASIITNYASKRTKPLIASVIGASSIIEGRSIIQTHGVAHIEYPEQAAHTLASMANYSVRTKRRKPNLNNHFPIPTMKHLPKQILLGKDAFDILREFHLPCAASIIAHTPLEARLFAESHGNSVALKCISSSIIHKTDLGAIRLNIHTDAIEQEFTALIHHGQSIDPSLSSILVMEMVDTKNALELIIGVTKEIHLGTFITIGLGGTFVELLHDISRRCIPMTIGDIMEMIDELSCSPLFHGYRGKPAYNTHDVIDLVTNFQMLLLTYPDIDQADLNPVLIYNNGKSPIILDARILGQGKTAEQTLPAD